MKKETYKEEVNFTEEQIKKDRRRDSAIDYSYDDKGSIFRKISKSRAEKKMHKEGHIGYSNRFDNNYDLGDYYDSSDYYNSSDYDDYDNVDSNYSSNDYNSTSNKDSNEIFNKDKSWVEQNASKESKDLFNTLKNEYKNMQSSVEAKKNKGFSKLDNKSNRKSKSSGYKICKNCGAQMYSDAKVCPKCGEEQKNKSGIKSIVLLIIIIIAISYIFKSDVDISFEEESTQEESYIEYDEYKKPVKLKYIAHPKDVIKIDKEKSTVGNGKDIPAGEYIFVKNEGTSLGSIEVISEIDQENSELYETAKRNYYVKLDDGDTVKLYNGTLYKADQVELDMTDENNRKSGMYRIGKDVGDTFTIEGNSRTYYAIFDADNIIIDNGFLDEGNITIDPAFIAEKAIQGETAKYIFVSDGIIK